MKWLVLALVIFAALQLYVRLAPTDPVRWHVDPDTAPDPGKGFARKDRTFPALSPAALWTRLEAAIASEPRARLIAGGAESGMATWELRSAFWGFPDYLTAKIVPNGEGAQVFLFSRQRFGKADGGVNAARLSRVLKALEQGAG